MSYLELQNYYREIFGLVDTFHFNSSLTRELYESRLGELTGEVISITHCDIADRRCRRWFVGDMLKMVFIGSITPYKGFPMLESVLTELVAEGFASWELSVWGGVGGSKLSEIIFRGGFSKSQLERVFDEDSLLIVPSIWRETFGFTTLEALSFGVPALLSRSVGSRDLVESIDPWFVFDSRDELKSRLRELMVSRVKLREFNVRVVEGEWDSSMSNHVNDIKKLYKR